MDDIDLSGYRFHQPTQWRRIKSALKEWLPYGRPDRVRFELCRFRWRLWALRYGGGREYGIRYQWLGLSLALGISHKD